MTAVAGKHTNIGAKRALQTHAERGVGAPVRRRVTLAHELGHLRCGHDGTKAAAAAGCDPRPLATAAADIGT